MAKVLIIIPAYNEAASIERVVREIMDRCPSCDYLVVNDCSTDATEEILVKNRFRHVRLCSNLGIGGAVQTGYRYALANGYDIAVQQDGDGQHDPAFLEEVIRPIREGRADLVIGSRYLRHEGFQSTPSRRAGIRYLCRIIRKVCGARVTDATSGYRGVGQKLIAFYAEEYAQDFPEPEAIVAAARRGYRVCEVPVVMRPRQGGRSSLNFMRSALYMVKVPLALFLKAISVKKEHAS